MAGFKHSIIRLYLYFLFFLFFVTGGLAMFLLAPLYKGAFAPHAPYRDLRIFRLWTHAYKIMWRSLSDKSYRDLYPSKMTDAPKFYNDRRSVKIKESWRGSGGSDGDCDLCMNSCCKQIKCPMLDKDGRRCLSYGSVYFGYLFCGRYPENQGQIDLYECPKWEVNK